MKMIALLPEMKCNRLSRRGHNNYSDRDRPGVLNMSFSVSIITGGRQPCCQTSLRGKTLNIVT